MYYGHTIELEHIFIIYPVQ